MNNKISLSLTLFVLPCALFAQSGNAAPVRPAGPYLSISADSGNFSTSAVAADMGLDSIPGKNYAPASPFEAYLADTPRQVPDATPPPPPPPKPKLVGSINAGFDYLRADLSAKQGPTANLAGWQATAQYDLNKHLGLFVDLTNFYATGGAPENVHGLTGGPSFLFPIGKKFTPFAFAEIGSSRASAKSTINWYTTLVVGAGATFNFSHDFSFEVIPAEYVPTRQKGEWISNYESQVNLVYNIYKRP